jgi:putative restriction endonuclease
MIRSVADAGFEARARLAALDWLRERSAVTGEETVRRKELMQGVTVDGRRLALIDLQRGIRKPAGFESALAITTTYTPPGQAPPYADEEGADGLTRYHYRADARGEPENAALRAAMRLRVRVIWFVGVAPGVYLPRWPVYVVADDPVARTFSLALDDDQVALVDPSTEQVAERAYSSAITRRRLHQPLFRARVLSAYETHCAVCRLEIPGLLDAAHIVGDRLESGDPVVPNGLALCKIHHAAFDLDILGIRPDLVVEVNRRTLEQVDGPMLEHGLKDRHGQRLMWVPRRQVSRPDRDRLERRYEEFRAAG